MRLLVVILMVLSTTAAVAQNYDPLPLKVLSNVKPSVKSGPTDKPAPDSADNDASQTAPAARSTNPNPSPKATKVVREVATPIQVSPGVLRQSKTDSKTPILVPQGSRQDHYANLRYEQKSLTMVPGVLEVVPIAQGHMNRIETPFDVVHVKTQTTAEVKTEKNIIYVNTTQSKPIVIYFYEHGEPELALSLALHPGKIPPLNVKVSLSGAAGNSDYMTKKARKWEEKNDYKAGLVQLLKTIGLQEIPEGYSLQAASAAHNPELFQCKMQGLDIQLKQMLVGHHYKVGIHRVVNELTVPVEIRESACYQDGVLAAGAWPSIALRPGEKTELYIVQSVDTSAVKPPQPARPSVLY